MKRKAGKMDIREQKRYAKMRNRQKICKKKESKKRWRSKKKKEKRKNWRKKTIKRKM